METRQSEELTLRQYLLGRLDAPPEITERLEERILMDSDFAELVGVIEDEIIEDYLEGALDPKERDSVERHFLRPPERQEKLRRARLVNQSLKSSARSATSTNAGAVPLDHVSKVPSSALWRPSMRMWAELGACALLAFTITYAFKAHQEVQTTRAQSDQQLAAERERSAQLKRQLQDLRQMAQPATIMLSLFRPGVTRSNAALPELKIGQTTTTVHVEIALQFAPPWPVDVRLENADGKSIWIANGQSAFRSNSDTRLILEVPAQGIESGDYRFVVSQSNGADVTYAFSVSRP